MEIIHDVYCENGVPVSQDLVIRENGVVICFITDFPIL
jgi:hypothetical protein